MSKRGDIELIFDIQESIVRIMSYAQGLSYSQFLKDSKTQDAIVRNFEILGEASKNLSRDFRSKHKNISWSEMARFRDKLIHGYSGISYDMVWEAVEERLPELSIQISELIRSEGW